MNKDLILIYNDDFVWMLDAKTKKVVGSDYEPNFQQVLEWLGYKCKSYDDVGSFIESLGKEDN